MQDRNLVSGEYSIGVRGFGYNRRLQMKKANGARWDIRVAGLFERPFS